MNCRDNRYIYSAPPPHTPLPNWWEVRGQNWGGREGERDGWEGGREGCDGNYEVGAYGMECVHNREPERRNGTA